jgi:Uri superfamily endonuclease
MNVDASLISELSTSGVYMLILFVPKEVTLTIGRLGKQRFPMGYYTYTGSALGKGSSNLKHRISRHLRKEKQRFWHIDYLLADPNVSVEAVVAAETSNDLECSLNRHMKKMKEAEVPVNGFGASDCTKNCGSHLLYFPETENPDCLVQKLVKYLKSSAGILSVCVIR